MVVDSDFKGGCELNKAETRKTIWKHEMKGMKPLGVDQRFIGRITTQNRTESKDCYIEVTVSQSTARENGKQEENGC